MSTPTVVVVVVDLINVGFTEVVPTLPLCFFFFFYRMAVSSSLVTLI